MAVLELRERAVAIVAWVNIEDEQAPAGYSDIRIGSSRPPAPDQILVDAGAVRAMWRESAMRMLAGVLAVDLAACADKPADARLDPPERQHWQAEPRIGECGIEQCDHHEISPMIG